MKPDLQARFEHRRLRLQELVAALERSGAKRAWFSTAIGKSDSYVSRLIRGDVSSRHRKNIGDELMTAVSDSLGLAPGWFDLPLGSEIPTNIRIDKSGSVHRPDGVRPPPSHTVLPFEKSTIDALLDLPERWKGRAEQAVLEVLKDFQRAHGEPPDPPDPSSVPNGEKPSKSGGSRASRLPEPSATGSGVGHQLAKPNALPGKPNSGIK